MKNEINEQQDKKKREKKWNIAKVKQLFLEQED